MKVVISAIPRRVRHAQRDAPEFLLMRLPGGFQMIARRRDRINRR